MAKGEPPLSDVHPMRVLFMIPRENPPQLDEHFSRPLKEFVQLCLKKTPSERPSAKELLKHRFIKTARKSPRLLERIRERPKFFPKQDMVTQKDIPSHYDEGTGTVRAVRHTRDETVRSSQGRISRSFGGDSSMDGLQGTGTGTLRAVRDLKDETAQQSQWKSSKSFGWESGLDVQGTGTVRSAVKPLQDSPKQEKRSEVPYTSNLLRKVVDREKQKTPSSISSLDEQNSLNLFYKDDKLKDKGQENSADDDLQPVDVSGTVVVRSPRTSQMHLAFNHLSPKPLSRFGSFEEASISGTVVLRTQQDESDTSQSSKSRLGIQEKTPAAPPEDSATNLAEAKAALQAGVKKGISRPIAKPSRDNSESFDVQKVSSKSRHSDGDGNAQAFASAASPTLSSLIIPSLKEAAGDRPDGSRSRAAIEALMDLELQKPGVSEALMCRLLQRLGSSKEASMKNLQDLAGRIFSKYSEAIQDAAESKTKPSTQPADNPSVSPLARFLISRWQSQVEQDLNAF